MMRMMMELKLVTQSQMKHESNHKLIVMMKTIRTSEESVARFCLFCDALEHGTPPIQKNLVRSRSAKARFWRMNNLQTDDMRKVHSAE
jgi:hypothetical protein